MHKEGLAKPRSKAYTESTLGANARAFNRWLTEQWLDNYPYPNVLVFDFYNVLTSNGGSWRANDLDRATGNHHRWRDGGVQYVTDQGRNTTAYPDGGGDDHPSPAGNQKATAEFIPLLNLAFSRWQAAQAAPAA